MPDDISQEDIQNYKDYQRKLQHMRNIGGFLGDDGIRDAKDERIRAKLDAEKQMAQRPVKWIWIMNPSNPNDTRVVKVIVDLWADRSFVPESLAKEFNFMVDDEEIPVQHCVLSGDTFETNKSAEISLLGKKSRTLVHKFCMLPPQQGMEEIVVGQDFTNANEDFLLDKDPSPGTAYWTTLKKPNAKEVLQMNAARQQADADYALLARNREGRQDRSREKSGNGDTTQAFSSRKVIPTERPKKL